MNKRILILLILPLALLGCKESALNITIRYDQIQALKEVGCVIFAQNLTALSCAADGYCLTDLLTKNNFAGAAAENSKFFIVEGPQNKERQVSEDSEKELENLRKGFEQFLEDLRSVVESEEFKKLEKELERLAEEMKRSGKSAREKIQKELLPKLKEEVEKLRKRLRKFGREDELEPLETQMEKVREI